MEQTITSNSKKNIFGNYKTYEADVVVNSTLEAWEVKPAQGKDPRPQLALYKKDGNYKEGHRLKKMEDIPIVMALKMRIDFPYDGAAIYSFYKKDKDGKEIAIPTTEAKADVEYYFKELDASINGRKHWWEEILPKFPLPIPGLPAIPVPAI